MRDLMIDIETMGTGNNPAMIQIAGVFFDRKTGQTFDEFERCIDLDDCTDHGFETTESTKQWWLEQNPEVLKDILSRGDPVKKVMEKYSSFACHEDVFVWSHATFDFVIVQHYLTRFKLKYMPYRNARDIRTLVDLSGIDLDKYDWSKGKTHNALDDCKFQIQYCVDAIRMIRATK